MTAARARRYPAVALDERPTPTESFAIASDSVSPRRLSYMALMVAAGLTSVYAETIPNFELLTLVVFCSGVLLGVRGGIFVGALTMLVYSLLNPYGAVHPLVTMAQVSGEALVGCAGGVFGALGLANWALPVRAVVLALLAVVLTAFYDLVTNVATGLLFGQMRLTLLGGIPFALWHIGFNLGLFVLLGTPLVAVFARYRKRLSASR